jgi:S-DNA-T family DNA segregation ATPase FtsK/SpoIIIE
VTASQPSDDVGLFDVKVGETSEGHPFVMNLIRDGPHCVVSGMTGSGKTSFIVGWLSLLCAQTKASSLEVAIIDFKGGIDFVPLATFPHCVGFATDLDVGAIDRALLGLGAEIRRRESQLRSGTRLDELSRLIVVIDEYRAVAAAHPSAVGIIVDLAARGRALGIHLVLSTQRASSSVSEDILANVPVRIAFRALTSHESTFLIGEDRAHRELVNPGDAIVATSVGYSVRVRITAPTDGGPATQRDAFPLANTLGSAQRGAVRQVWSDPLPTRISRIEVESLPARVSPAADADTGTPSLLTNYGLCLGVVDAHDRQRWESAWYSPPNDGHLLITGTARTGRSGAIRSLVDAAQAQADEPVTTRLIADEIELWDWFDPGYRRNVTEGAAPKLEHPGSTLVLLDGIEGMMSNLNPDARDEMSERLMRALRTPDSRTPTVAPANLHVTRFVIACDAGGAWSTRLSALCAQRLDFETDGPPGRARFGGAMMQVPFVEQATCPDATVTPQSLAEVPLNESLVVVDGELFGQTPLPAQHAAIEASARARNWIDRLGEFSALTKSSAVLLRGHISPSDARVLFRGRTPLPPVRGAQSILLFPDGTYERLKG